MTEVVDVCVVGAGPAGLAVATALHEFGVRSVVLDERPTPGGNIYRGALNGAFAHSDRLGSDYEKGARSTRKALTAHVDLRRGASVNRIDGDFITYHDGGGIRRVRAQFLVLATGALERPMPFAGWTLPGVMGAGAAQLLLKQSGMVPDGRYVLCGNGPLLLLLAKQFIDLGAIPDAILDTGVSSPLRVSLKHLPAVFGSLGNLAKGLSFLKTIRAAGVPVHRGVDTIAVEGDGGVRSIRFTANGRSQTLPVSLVLCSEGVIPNTQLSLALDCRHIWNEAQASFRPETDEWGETSRAGTFAIGDCAGILGAAAAPLGARLAALRIATKLGRTDGARSVGVAKPLRAQLARERSFRRFLDEAYRPTLSVETALADSLVVCRCENLAVGEIRAAVNDGARGPAQAKAFTRCGMGPCQGRICGPAVTRVLAEETGQTRDEVGNYHPRFPLKPATLCELAGAPEDDGSAHVEAA